MQTGLSSKQHGTKFPRGKNPNSLKNLKPIKKGHTLNPSGRKKGTSLTEILYQEIEKTCPADKEGRTWKELIIISTMRLAIKGNPTALAEVWNRFDGKVKQDVGLIAGDKVRLSVTFGETKEMFSDFDDEKLDLLKKEIKDWEN